MAVLEVPKLFLHQAAVESLHVLSVSFHPQAQKATIISAAPDTTGVQFFFAPFFFFFLLPFFFLSLRGLRGETANLAAV